MCSLKSRFMYTGRSVILVWCVQWQDRLSLPDGSLWSGGSLSRSRQTRLFYVPFGRVNNVKSGFRLYIPALCNRFLQQKPTADVLFQPRMVRSDVCSFARSQGSYIWKTLTLLQSSIQVIYFSCFILCIFTFISLHLYHIAPFAVKHAFIGSLHTMHFFICLFLYIAHSPSLKYENVHCERECMFVYLYLTATINEPWPVVVLN